MNIGDYADVQALAAQVGDDALRAAVLQVEAGQLALYRPFNIGNE